MPFYSKRDHLSWLKNALMAAFFKAPFPLLPFLIWSYFGISFLLSDQSSVVTGNLPDGDDYMYLNAIKDFLAGQNWFDSVQHRLDPEHAVVIEFTRLPQIPLIALGSVITFFVPDQNGWILLAFIWPVILLALFFKTLAFTAKSFVGDAAKNLTIPVALFATYLMFQFSPGHIDHHGLSALLILYGLGLSIRLLNEPDNLSHAVMAGTVFSLSLAVALEVLAPLLIILSFLTALSLIRGEKLARGVFRLSLAALLSSCFWLLLIRSPDDLLTADILGYSCVYVIFLAFYACLSLALYGICYRYGGWFRGLLGLSLAILEGAVFLSLFPDLAHGPYGAMDKNLARFMFTIIPEAKPILHKGISLIELFLRAL